MIDVAEEPKYLEHLTNDIAHVLDIPAQDLLTQVRLHLPRLLSDGTALDRQAVVSEVERLAVVVQGRIAPYRAWAEPPADPSPSLDEANLELLHDDEARIVLERFHYLFSFRFESLHLGLTVTRGSSRHLMALLTVSPFDLTHAASRLPPEVTAPEVGVVSRVYSFEWAPPNTTSYLMGAAFRYLNRREVSQEMLVTYLNRNLGFRGTSYEASNWVLFGREHGTRYAYLDGLYITDRELRRRFGTAEPEDLRCTLGPRFATTTIPMAPLILYAYFLRRNLRTRYRTGFQHELMRP